MPGTDIFHPNSPLARSTVDLFNTTLIVSAVIFALVSGLVVLCLVRFRGRDGQGEPTQARGNKGLEIAWTVVPVLVLAYLFTLTVSAMKASDPPGKGRAADVVVIGHQFWWEVRYPQSGVVTANEIHIPTGRKLLFELRTADVIHDFWVPQLARKIDMIPDRAHYIWVQADRPGDYPGACSEFCGVQHAWMRILVKAQPPGEFETWLQDQGRPVQSAGDQAIQRGANLVRQLTCVNCHTLDERTASLQAGPDLRHLASRQTLGAGVLQNTPANLALWIRNSHAVKPGNLMPRMELNEEQVRDVADYLERLR